MKIQKTSEITGLSVKTIHYYISEGLLKPNQNQDNHYYDFTNDDIVRLKQIHLLRKAGVSISMIHDIYRYPLAVNHYLSKSLVENKARIQKQLDELDLLYSIMMQIPPATTPDILQQDFFEIKNNHHLIDELYPAINERVLACYLLVPFIEIKENEFQNYLWEKLLLQLKKDIGIFCFPLYRLISEVNMDKLQAAIFKTGNSLTDSSNNFDDLTCNLISLCNKLVYDQDFQKQFFLLKNTIFNPIITFYKNTTNLIQEYSSTYPLIISTINQIQSKTINILKQDNTLYNHLINSSFNLQSKDSIYNDLFLLLRFQHTLLNPHLYSYDFLLSILQSDK